MSLDKHLENYEKDTQLGHLPNKPNLQTIRPLEEVTKALLN